MGRPPERGAVLVSRSRKQDPELFPQVRGALEVLVPKKLRRRITPRASILADLGVDSVNGVGLLLAASSHAEGAAMERARTLQRCYERLAAAPVPTIAAIEGNCYGCGLELALTCDYRIARDSYDTHFYMPELRDYAFIPLFGGTQRLPLLLGLRNGMQMLLGERIGARRAMRIGLVDRLAAGESVQGTVGALLSRLRAAGWPKRSPGGARKSPPPDLDALPGAERRLAPEGLRLAAVPVAAP